VAGQVTTQWKAEAGGEVELAFAEGPAASDKSATLCGLRISGENFPEVTLAILLHAELAASLQPQPAAAVPASTSSETALREATGAGAGTNLDLFLDVQLEATIRFGQRQLLLRDVLSMTPGSVVELDRQINEPAELLVAGRLVARGEVVVVDGNFGIRVTELSSPRQRVELLQA
jgi:flagellar motor switch protein FliN/FliY